MRKLISFVLVIVLLLASAIVSASPSILPDDVLSRLTINYDKFKDSYSVRPSFDYLEPPLDGTQVKLYAFHDANSKRLVMHVNYTGKGWIFFDYCIFLVGDQRYRTPIYSSVSDPVYRNVLSSTDLVSESIYMDAKDAEIMSIINSIETSNDNVAVEYKLYGSKGTISGKLSSRELQSWHDVFSYYASIELP